MPSLHSRFPSQFAFLKTTLMSLRVTPLERPIFIPSLLLFFLICGRKLKADTAMSTTSFASVNALSTLSHPRAHGKPSLPANTSVPPQSRLSGQIPLFHGKGVSVGKYLCPMEKTSLWASSKLQTRFEFFGRHRCRFSIGSKISRSNIPATTSATIYSISFCMD